MKRLTNLIEVAQNMGARYTGYRVLHSLRQKTGYYKRRHSVIPTSKFNDNFIELQNWRNNPLPFFFKGKDIDLSRSVKPSLRHRVELMLENKFHFFGKEVIEIDPKLIWHQNPKTEFTYLPLRHWSEVDDFSKESGDIKWIWELGRFSFLYDFIRYDFHENKDMSAPVFKLIEDFIDKNPVNLGPQYKCSQEISLRILNWTFALYYYKDSSHLSPALFSKILNSIYWQLDHVYKHIQFSRIAVRNNHAITESLTLYISGLLFPFMNDTHKWSKDGKIWLEEEVAYQFFDDGTYIQYSMNYHRVAIQLLTWAIRLDDLHRRELSPILVEKAKKSIAFFEACLPPCTDSVPNQGHNDGALFFKLDETDPRSYTSQINDLKAAINREVTKASESQSWYGLQNPQVGTVDLTSKRGVHQFPESGYFIYRDEALFTFFRCGGYRNRPAQDDNLHLDLWYNGVNILWDNGTYQYNTTDKLSKHFLGSKGHNSPTLGERSYMQQLGRFVWTHWIKQANVDIQENTDSVLIQGEIVAYKYIHPMKINRRIEIHPKLLRWEVTDSIEKNYGKPLTQRWYLNPEYSDNISFKSRDQDNQVLKASITTLPHSEHYGEKTDCPCVIFKTGSNQITTTITLQP